MTNKAHFTIEELIQATGGTLVYGEAVKEVSGVSTDTRSIENGNLFVALRGQHFNGDNFIPIAFELGASCVVGSSRDTLNNINLKGNRAENIAAILVDDTLSAYQDIAHFHRNRFKPLVIGITGSNGKSSTKEMAASVSNRRYRTLKNAGNLNNHIGVPITLLDLSEQDEVMIVEMGMRREGEIRRLCDLAEPDIGVITNITPAHLESLGSMEAIKRAKGELIDAVKKNGGTAILNADDTEVISFCDDFSGKVISFGIKKEADVRACNITRRDGEYIFNITAAGERGEVSLNSLGYHDIYNALAAAAVGVALKIDITEIIRGIGLYKPLPMRMESIKIDNITFINDAYNANPVSMEAAIKTLHYVDGRGKKILVMGDMLELGEESEELHIKIGRTIARQGIDLFYSFGEMSILAARAAREGMSPDHVYHSDSYNDLISAINRELSPGDCVMVKGSRAMGMEKIIDGLKKIRTNC